MHILCYLKNHEAIKKGRQKHKQEVKYRKYKERPDFQNKAGNTKTDLNTFVRIAC